MLKLRRSKFILGVTGNISCGKSTVAGMFKNKDCLLIDADKLASRLLSFGAPVYKKIKNCFGSAILKDNRRIDRKKLAEVVFSDKASLIKLNRIMHPELIRQIRRNILNTRKKTVILDAALIVESGIIGLVDKLVVVTANKEQQIRRSQKSRGLSKQEVVLRMKSQISQKAKSRFADFIIDNSKQLSKTQKQVSKIRRQLWKS